MLSAEGVSQSHEMQFFLKLAQDFLEIMEPELVIDEIEEKGYFSARIREGRMKSLHAKQAPLAWTGNEA